MRQTSHRNRIETIGELRQLVSCWRGAAAQQSKWLIDQYGTDERGRDRPLKEVMDRIAKDFGVSERTARRWTHGELATLESLEKFRKVWGLSFILHLYADGDAEAEQALALLRDLTARRERLIPAGHGAGGACLVLHSITARRARRIEDSIAETCRWLAARHQPAGPVAIANPEVAA